MATKRKPIPPLPPACPKCKAVHVDAKGRRLCVGHSSRTKKACQKIPMTAQAVCMKHGGKAPQALRKAAERVRDLLGEALDPDNAMRETAAIAYARPRAIWDDDGNLRPLSQWPEDLVNAVKRVQVLKRNLFPDDGKVDDVIQVEFWDKPKAVEMLMKHHGKLKDVEVTVNVDITDRLAAGRKRVADARARK